MTRESDPSSSSSPLTPTDVAARVGRLTAEDLIPDQALTATDEDAFNHSAIGQTLADLVLTASPPLNVALFGRWGSGKSSVYELLRRAVETGDPEGHVSLVRYDAWKYGGESLQRNFISFAATKLGFEEEGRQNREFHRGLYEKRRGAEFSFAAKEDQTRLQHLAPLGLFAAVFGALVVVFSVLVGLASTLTDESFLGQIAVTLPGFLVSTGGVAVLVAGAKLVADGVTTDVEQSQPSAEEQFAKTFDSLVKRAKGEKGKTRLVFFIDELDRCAPKDVVATLTGIKTFLDHEDCVFIVAADREVLESALDALPQSTPFDPEAPYYSSASSFFDKIFQHQMPLPPLRGRRLTGFARDRVVERGGLWRDLRDAQPNHRLLDRVMYVLIPSHVRSPRRVKVLLNAFATNVRVAEGRGIAWLDYALELAKLTALQTEFPVLAADLQHEPRLPEYLLSAPHSPSDRVAALIARHGGTHPSGTFLDGDDPAADDLQEAAPTDVPLNKRTGGAAGAADEKDMMRMQHALLRRYLERTGDVPSPGRQLLYLEAAGAAVGLEDGELGELIETYAPEAPNRVIDAVGGRSNEEQRQVIRVLADMCDREFGEERANVVTALLGVADLVAGDLNVEGRVAVAAIAGFENERPLADDQLPSALALALGVGGDLAEELAKRLSDSPELLASPSRVQSVARLLGKTPEGLTTRIHERVGEEMGTDPHVLLDPLAVIDDAAGRALLDDTGVGEAVDALFAAGDDEFIDGLIASAEQKPGTAAWVQSRLLLRSTASPTYSAARENASKVRPLFDSAEVNEQAMLALGSAPPEDWDYWVDYLNTDSEQSEFWAVRPVTRLLAGVPEADAASVRGTLEAVVPLLGGGYTYVREQIVEVLRSSLAATAWWSSDEARTAQETKHRLAWLLLDAPDESLTQEVRAALVDDIERPRLGAITVPATVVLNGAVAEGLRLLSEGLPADDVAQLYTSWVDAPLAEDAASQSLFTLALLRVASLAVAGGADIDVSALTVERIAAMPSEWLRRGGLTPVQDWLSLNPSRDAVAAHLQVQAVTPAAQQAVTEYSAVLSGPDRTELAGALFQDRADDRWLTSVARGGDVDYMELTTTLTDALRDAGNDTARNDVVRYLVALKPVPAAAQKLVGDLMVELVDARKAGKFTTALDLLPALGTDHRSGGTLKAAFIRASESGFKVKRSYEPELRRVNLTLPKKCFVESKSRFGRARDGVGKAANDLRPGRRRKR